MASVNWLAVLVSGFVTFVIGAGWYSPAAFGKQWQAAYGINMADKVPVVPMAVSVVCYIVMAFTLAQLIAWIGVIGILGGIGLGLLVGIGLIAASGLTNNRYQGRPLEGFAIDAGYSIVSCAVMGAILAVWR